MTIGYRLLVCGGRDFADRDFMYAKLDELFPDGINVVMCHGDQRGADKMSGEWGKSRGFTVIPYPADWGKYDKAAGPIRNRQMLKEFRPNVVVAFPGGDGTGNMVRISRAAGVLVIRVS